MLFNVIRAELFKALRKRRSYILAGFVWLIVPALLLLIGWLVQVNVEGTFMDDGTSVRDLIQAIASPIAVARNNLLFLGNSVPIAFFIIAVTLLATLLIGEEHTQNMWKTVLTAQPSRFTVLFGKFLTAMILLGGLMLGMYLTGFLFGGAGTAFLQTTFAGDWQELARLYALQWLFGGVAILFAFLMVWWIRNLPLGVVTIFFLPGLLEGAYSLYRTVIGFERLNRLNAVLQTLRLRGVLEDLPRYFFTTNLYAPSRKPLQELSEVFGSEIQLGGPLGGLFSTDLTRSAWVMVVYAAIFGVLLVWSFTRRDMA